MALQISGKCLDIRDEWVEGPSGRFQSFEAKILTGKADIETVRMGRDVATSDYPKEGEEVTFEVSIRAFARKAGGAGYNVTALSRVRAGRVAAAS